MSCRRLHKSDFRATHIIVYSGDEPIGSTRLRWFNNFVKMERNGCAKGVQKHPDSATARIVRRRARGSKGLHQSGDARRGQYAKIWTRLFGWREVAQKPPTVLGGEEYIELIREFDGAADPLTPESDSRILLRVEGYWDQPTALETSF